MPKRKIHLNEQELKTYREDNTPKRCPILLLSEITAVVDHDHLSGMVRAVISNEANILIGRIENCIKSRCRNAEGSTADILRRIADYLEKPQSIYHPIGLRQVVKRFSSLSAGAQKKILFSSGYTSETIDTAKNKRKRANLYRKALLKQI